MIIALGYRVYLIGVSFFFLSAALLPSALAQDRPFSLVTSPLPISLSTAPGKAVSTELRVKNASSQTERLKVSLFKFSVNERSEVRLAEKGQGDEFMDWVSFSPAVFEAAPNEWRTVKMNIDVPADAALGYYYAVGFSRAEAATPQPGAATLEGQVITFVLMDVVVPGAKRELKIDELSADRSTYEFLPANLTVRVRNSGNIHLAPKGTVFISRGSKTVATLSVNPNQGNVLPGSTRSFTTQWKDGFPVYEESPEKNADGSSKRKLKWDFSKVPDLRFGKYTAKLVLVYDDGQRDVPIEGTVSFWVVPWRVLGGVLAIALLAGVGLWSTGRKAWKGMRRLKD